MPNGNGNGNGVVLRWAVGIILTILLLWMGGLQAISRSHATKSEVAAVEERNTEDVSKAEGRMTRRLERIEDKIDRLVERD